MYFDGIAGKHPGTTPQLQWAPATPVAGAFCCLREQLRARLRELHIGAAFVRPEPALRDGVVQPGTVLGRGLGADVRSWV